MAIDPPLPDPDLERIDALIVHCEKRRKRSAEKLTGAVLEHDAAQYALAAAKAARDLWIRDHPDPQGELAI